MFEFLKTIEKMVITVLVLVGIYLVATKYFAHQETVTNAQVVATQKTLAAQTVATQQQQAVVAQQAQQYQQLVTQLQAQNRTLLAGIATRGKAEAKQEQIDRTSTIADLAARWQKLQGSTHRLLSHAR